MLGPQNTTSWNKEYVRLLYRVAESPCEALDFSYTHRLAAGLIEVDVEPILNSRHGSEFSDCDSQGRTPLHWAAMRANVPATRALLRGRVDVQVRDNEGRTVLHYAALSGSHRSIELLLIAGSDVSTIDYIGYQPLHGASIRLNSRESFDVLLMAGADVHALTLGKSSALHLACSRNLVDNAVALLEAGADIDQPDGDGDSPLSDAIFSNSVQATQLLLNCGAKVQSKNKFGNTVLHSLALCGKIDEIALFMSCRQLEDMDVEQKNNDGHTAWELLEDRPAPPDGFVEAFKTLLARCEAQKNTGAKIGPVELGEWL